MACTGGDERTAVGKEHTERDVIDLQCASTISNAPDVYANLMGNVSGLFASANERRDGKDLRVRARSH